MRARPGAEKVPRAVVVKYPQFAAPRQCEEIGVSVAVDIASSDPDDVPSTAQLDGRMPRQGHLNAAATQHANVKPTVAVEIDSDSPGSAGAGPAPRQLHHRCFRGRAVRRWVRHSARGQEHERADQRAASVHGGMARL
jgi:hypothetical protein